MPSRVTLDDELLYPSQYVSAPDLKGKDVTVTISATNAEELMLTGGKRGKKKLILTFKEAKKKLVCNVTNANTLVDLYGTRAEDFVGKRITIYPTKANFGGKMVDAVRIRDKVPSGKAAAPPAEMSEEMPPLTEDAAVGEVAHA